MIHMYFFVITSYLGKIELVNIISNTNANCIVNINYYYTFIIIRLYSNYQFIRIKILRRLTK